VAAVQMPPHPAGGGPKLSAIACARPAAARCSSCTRRHYTIRWPPGVRPHPTCCPRDQPPGFPFEGYDLEELILPDGDDMGINSGDDASEEEEVEAESGFGSVIGAQPGPGPGARASQRGAARRAHRGQRQLGWSSPRQREAASPPKTTGSGWAADRRTQAGREAERATAGVGSVDHRGPRQCRRRATRAPGRHSQSPAAQQGGQAWAALAPLEARAFPTSPNTPPPPTPRSGPPMPASPLYPLTYPPHNSHGPSPGLTVVDNLPKVPEEKYEKLANVLKKIYGQIGNIRDGAGLGRGGGRGGAGEGGMAVGVGGAAPRAGRRPATALPRASPPASHAPAARRARRSPAPRAAGGVFMPKDEANVSKGYAFIEFSHPMVRAARGLGSVPIAGRGPHRPPAARIARRGRLRCAAACQRATGSGSLTRRASRAVASGHTRGPPPPGPTHLPRRRPPTPPHPPPPAPPRPPPRPPRRRRTLRASRPAATSWTRTTASW
jgi:hypothetical protein